MQLLWYTVNTMTLGDAYTCQWTWSRDLITFGSTHYLSPFPCQAIAWISVCLLTNGPSGANITYISFNKVHVIMLSAKWRPFCLVLSMLIPDILPSLLSTSRRHPTISHEYQVSLYEITGSLANTENFTYSVVLINTDVPCTQPIKFSFSPCIDK